ncbi:MAG: hypothetical protein QOD42_2208 [Sphingomonadales bacterium]|jgi:hypothetical protein|nr:hypothetical protein [Sphingomonadales bacterium]
MRRSLLLAALAALAAATPAAAADIAGLDCPDAALSEAQRGALADAVVAMVDRSDSRLDPLRAAVRTCAARLHWSDRAAAAATTYHVAAAGSAQLRRRLAEAGVDVSPLDRAVLADRALHRALISGDGVGAALAGFRARNDAIVERVIRGRSGDMAELIGNYTGFAAAAVAMRFSFIEN